MWKFRLSRESILTSDTKPIFQPRISAEAASSNVSQTKNNSQQSIVTTCWVDCELQSLIHIEQNQWTDFITVFIPEILGEVQYNRIFVGFFGGYWTDIRYQHRIQTAVV